MSWHFSQALAGAYSAVNFSAGELSAQLNLIPFAADDSCSDKMKGTWHCSPFGTMFVPSTEVSGRALLTWFREDFLANPSARQRTESKLPLICGQKCSESSEKLAPRSSLQRMSHEKLSQKPHRTASNSVIGRKLSHCPRKTWV